MDDPIIIAKPNDVEAALLSLQLVPPAGPANLGQGSMADLRNAMARFSGPGDHAPRRSAVDQVVASLDSYPFTAQAHHRTMSLTTAAQDHNATEIGSVVPVETMATALGVSEAEVQTVRREVAQVAAVIGRGNACTTDDDAAASALVERFGSGDHAIAVVSVLYQTHDATAALFAAALDAHRDGNVRQLAVTKTVRVATTNTTVGGHDVVAGATVVINLAPAGFEFGVGHHHCPGRSIAERIVAGMMQALTSTNAS